MTLGETESDHVTLGDAASHHVTHLVVEDGEVKGETESDRMRWLQLLHGDVAGSLVGDQTVLGCVLALLTRRELGQIPLVVALPVT